jgi:hypothetical protein
VPGGSGILEQPGPSQSRTGRFAGDFPHLFLSSCRVLSPVFDVPSRGLLKEPTIAGPDLASAARLKPADEPEEHCAADRAVCEAAYWKIRKRKENEHGNKEEAAIREDAETHQVSEDRSQP